MKKLYIENQCFYFSTYFETKYHIHMLKKIFFPYIYHTCIRFDVNTYSKHILYNVNFYGREYLLSIFFVGRMGENSISFITHARMYDIHPFFL
jgi:hypothetical protein